MFKNKIITGLSSKSIALITIAFLSSCTVTHNSTNTSITDIPVAQPLKYLKTGLFWATASPTMPNGMTIEQYKKLEASMGEYQLKYQWSIRQIANAPSWQQAHQIAQKILEEFRDHPFAFGIEQEVSSSMLRSFFIHLEPKGEALIAMKFYMDILYRHQSFREVSLMAQMLPRMQDVWNKEQLTTASVKCLKSYNTSLARAKRSKEPFTLIQYLRDKKLIDISVNTNSNQEQQSFNEEQIRQGRKKLALSIPSMLEKLSAVDDFDAQTEWLLNPSIDAAAIVAFFAEESK
jgi:hypothetical protein